MAAPTTTTTERQTMITYVPTGARSTYYVVIGGRSVGIVSKREGTWHGLHLASKERATAPTRDEAAEIITRPEIPQA